MKVNQVPSWLGRPGVSGSLSVASETKSALDSYHRESDARAPAPDEHMVSPQTGIRVTGSGGIVTTEVFRK